MRFCSRVAYGGPFLVIYGNPLKRSSFVIIASIPKIEINTNNVNIEKKSYKIETSELSYLEKKEEIISVRSEFLQKFGISAH